MSMRQPNPLPPNTAKQKSSIRKLSTMEISNRPSLRNPFPPHLLYPYYHYAIPQNYVHWVQTPDSHIFSADLPGVRKEEIKVEVEDSRYLIIRTEAVDGVEELAKSFSRKFRLPVLVDVDAISAGFENGVLEITVPRSFRRASVILPTDSPDQLQLLARAA
ncbi:15.4 kDa class V heat shock protein [Momordica charantia]|uniref:15.4 kDa class V heat shock protein n=1 Tax=Momordica charantia TaxID=3673 RepID=A0A6J1CFU3_MOMCH|nr:15.4 kDa class V heat shock protein [Momordica charantia]